MIYKYICTICGKQWTAEGQPDKETERCQCGEIFDIHRQPKN